MIGKEEPEDVRRSVMYAEDGLNFTKTHNFANSHVPTVPEFIAPRRLLKVATGK